MTDPWEKRQRKIRQGTESHLRFNNNIYIGSLKRGHERPDRTVNPTKLSEGIRERGVDMNRENKAKKLKIVMCFNVLVQSRCLFMHRVYQLLSLLSTPRVIFANQSDVGNQYFRVQPADMTIKCFSLHCKKDFLTRGNYREHMTWTSSPEPSITVPFPKSNL